MTVLVTGLPDTSVVHFESEYRWNVMSPPAFAVVPLSVAVSVSAAGAVAGGEASVCICGDDVPTTMASSVHLLCAPATPCAGSPLKVAWK